MKKFIVLLMALPLLFGAASAHAQLIPQPLKRTEATATATTTKTPDGKVTTTQTSKMTTTTPVAPPPAKPVVPAAKPEPKPELAKREPLAEQPHLHKYEQLVIGMKDNQDLAAHIDASLAIDPKGDRPLTPAICQPNGYSCGTPNMLLTLALKSDPDRKGRLTLQNLSAFVRSLVLIKDRDPPGSQRWMGGIIRNTRTVKWDAMSRAYGPNEKVYADPENMRPVIPLNCVNFIGDIVPEIGCAEIHFFLRNTNEVHTGPEGNPIVVAPDDVCRPALKRPGETEFENTALLDECPRLCGPNWFSFEAKVPGEYVLRLPKNVAYSDVVLDFCLLFADGTQTNATVITKTAYTRLWRAYIDFPDKVMSKESREKISWVGLVHTWQMSDQRAYMGARPPPEGLSKK